MFLYFGILLLAVALYGALRKSSWLFSKGYLMFALICFWLEATLWFSRHEVPVYNRIMTVLYAVTSLCLPLFIIALNWVMISRRHSYLIKSKTRTYLSLFFASSIIVSVILSLGLLVGNQPVLIMRFIQIYFWIGYYYLCTFIMYLLFNLLLFWRRWPNSADVLMVLGSKLNPDTTLSSTLINRLDLALDLYQQYPEAQIIVTGGCHQGQSVSEGERMAEYLVQRDVPLEQITIEGQAKHTYDNIVNTQSLLDVSDQQVVGVTSWYHLMRASYLACREQMDAEWVGAMEMGRWPLYAMVREFVGFLSLHSELNLLLMTLMIIYQLFSN